MSESIETVPPPSATEPFVRAAIFMRGEESEEAWAFLLQPAHAETTVAILTSMLNQVNGDLATRSAKTMTREELVDFREWRHRALGFKGGVERRLVIAKATLKTYRVASSNDRNIANRESLRILARAVLDHQQASRDAGITSEAHDLRLWHFLDTLVIPVGTEELTLTEMFDNGPWSGQ